MKRDSGFRESVQTMWIYTTRSAAKIHAATSKVANLNYVASEQHKEMEKTKFNSDYPVIYWVKVYDPFNKDQENLLTLSCG